MTRAPATAAQAETVAELRRRAEVAEQALATVAAQPAPAPVPAASDATQDVTTAEASTPPPDAPGQAATTCTSAPVVAAVLAEQACPAECVSPWP